VRNSIIGCNSTINGALLDGSLLGDNTSVRGRSMSLNAGDSSEINFEAEESE